MFCFYFCKIENGFRFRSLTFVSLRFTSLKMGNILYLTSKFTTTLSEQHWQPISCIKWTKYTEQLDQINITTPQPESSPFIGGPRIEPTIRDMYTMRSIRIDPTISLSGNVLSGEGSKTNRLSIGEAASRLALRKISLPSNLSNAQGQDDQDPALLDISLTSFTGTDAPTEDEWQTQFTRLFERLSSPSGGATLFTAEFGSVPNVRRLAEWIASKWAPAILRSYDIAGTRVGARPVYAVQTEDNVVEIVWQELVNFQPVTSGRMVITVEETGLTAARGKGDETKGFGKVSRVPLPGEDILVRRLGDAASQAVEKGLATKVSETDKLI